METQLKLQVDLLERGTYQNLADLKEQIMLFAKEIFNGDELKEQNEELQSEADLEDDELSEENFKAQKSEEDDLEDDDLTEEKDLNLEDDEFAEESDDDLELEDESEDDKSEDWNKEDDDLDHSRL
ncbi:MAG: hypothetical protein H7141_07100 [Burkholderiales bacterium]|nr:hypothetical protein [Bacteroidia bacterium]